MITYFNNKMTRSDEINDLLRKFIPLENECLDLISFSEQRLTRFTSRILITMKRNEKINRKYSKYHEYLKSMALPNLP